MVVEGIEVRWVVQVGSSSAAELEPGGHQVISVRNARTGLSEVMRNGICAETLENQAFPQKDGLYGYFLARTASNSL